MIYKLVLKLLGYAIFSFSSSDNNSCYNPLNKKAVAELIRLNTANLVQRDGVKSMMRKNASGTKVLYGAEYYINMMMVEYL